MAEYVLIYKGSGKMPEGEEAQKQMMEAWTKWFDSIGSGLVNKGNPFGPAKTVSTSGEVSDGGASGLAGYSIINADSLDAATEHAKTCPVLGGGSSVEVYETFPIM